MAHPYVITLVILSSVVIQEVLTTIYDEPYLTGYDPFKPQKQKCEEQPSSESISCFSWGYSKNKRTEGHHNSGYKQKQSWWHFFGTNELTVSVGDYFNQAVRKEILKNKYISDETKMNAGCKRINVISARGVKFDGFFLVGECEGDNPFAQLMLIDDVLWYYPTMRIKWDSSRERVIIVSKKNGETKENDFKIYCEKKYYNIQPGSSNVKEEKTERVEYDLANDEDCVALKKGETGSFPISSLFPLRWYYTPKNQWGVNILGEGLFGVNMIRYNEPFCHWKMIMLWNGSPYTGTAMFCGEFRGMIVTDTGLYFGNKMAAIMSPESEEVVVLINPRNGECIKQKYKMKTTKYHKETNKFVEKQSITTMHESEQECENFKQGKLSEKEMDSGLIASVEKMLIENKIDVVPYGVETFGLGPVSLSTFKAKDIYIDINMGRDMGVVSHFVGKTTVVTLVAQGIVIDVAILNEYPTFSVQKDTIICGNQLMFKRDTQDKNLFTVTAKWDNNFCTRTRYVLIKKDGKLYRQEVFPAEIGVSNNECRSLIARGFENKNGNEKSEELSKQIRVLQPKMIERDLANYIA